MTTPLPMLTSSRGIKRTSIEWADYAVGSPFRFKDKRTGEVLPSACVKVSSGCANCYAEQIGLRFEYGRPYTKVEMSKLDCVLDHGVIENMLSFRPKPPKGETTFKGGRSRPTVFFGDTTDIFGEWVQPEQLDTLFASFAVRPDVDWLILTCSVEDQKSANERIPHLLKCPAAVRFLSCEPMLEVVDLERWMSRESDIDWVICGGESGKGARPFDIKFARSLRDQCEAAGVPFFMKQLGAMPTCGCGGDVGAWARHHGHSRAECAGCGIVLPLQNSKGSEPSEWPSDLRVREWPKTQPPKTNRRLA